MPSEPTKQAETLTFGDRFVTALLGGICSFGTMLVIWFVVMYVGGRAGNDVAFPFYWVWIVSGTVAALAFLAGPERTMDVFEKVWGLIGLVLFRRVDRR
jgi:hypothetical protein